MHWPHTFAGLLGPADDERFHEPAATAVNGTNGQDDAPAGAPAPRYGDAGGGREHVAIDTERAETGHSKEARAAADAEGGASRAAVSKQLAPWWRPLGAAHLCRLAQPKVCRCQLLGRRQLG